MPIPPRIHERLSRHAGHIQTLLAHLTLEEKCRLCHAVTGFTSGGAARLGIPGLVMSDGPHGVREEQDARNPDADHRVTYLPTGSSLAATWSPEMAALHGSVLGAEARARGKDIILGPGFNLTRTPMCGRNFEYLGEDPLLAGTLAAAAIQAIQEHDVAACAKHFAVNDQEAGRMGVDAVVDERTLRELHLAAFEMAVVEGGVLSVMGAYNRLNGQFCCANNFLLRQVLKDEWGFPGLVVSDWGAVHDTVGSALGGCDIEMGGLTPGDAMHFGDALVAAVRQGTVPLAVINDKVLRILRLLAAIGAFDPTTRSRGAINLPAHRQAARRIADEALVLLRNQDNVLPWDGSTIRRLAVIGDLADLRNAAGGGSSSVHAYEEPTVLESLRSLLGPQVEIEHVRGWPIEVSGYSPIPVEVLTVADAAGIRGWRAEWYNNRRFLGASTHTTVEPAVDRRWEDLDQAGLSVRWTGELVVPADGEYQFRLLGTDCVVLLIDNILKISLWGHPGSISGTCSAHWKAGERHRLCVLCNPKAAQAECRLAWRMPGAAPITVPPDATKDAVAAARRADAVLVVAGTSHYLDTEGRDLDDYRLPFEQDAVITAVAQAASRTAVIVISGAPISLPWTDRVGAIVWTGYAGMAMAPAVVDLLFGRTDPRGRLPWVWPRRLPDVGCHALGEYHPERVVYREGLLLGQRWFDAHHLKPLFPFGHGLSYTRFSLTEASTAPDIAPVAALASVTVNNTGTRSGSTVVQAYAENPHAPDPKPPCVLAGFCKIHLGPGESRRITIPIARRSLAWWDAAAHLWRLTPGRYTIRLAFAADDAGLKTTCDLD